MEIYISIDGVLRNTIQKLDYHYRDAYLDSEFESENNFDSPYCHLLPYLLIPQPLLCPTLLKECLSNGSPLVQLTC